MFLYLIYVYEFMPDIQAYHKNRHRSLSSINTSDVDQLDFTLTHWPLGDLNKILDK